MIILNVGIWYDLCGLDCQKKKKKGKKKSKGTLRCLSHALDPLGFGAWHSGRSDAPSLIGAAGSSGLRLGLALLGGGGLGSPGAPNPGGASTSI